MIQLTTTITAVSVYPDRARVTRSGQAHLGQEMVNAGPQRIEISGLPLTLAADSLRAAARGTARARLLGVQVESTFYEETPAEQPRKLEDEIQELQDELAASANRAALIKQNRLTLEGLLGQVQTYATALASGEMSVESQMTLLDGLRARAETLDAEAQQVSIRRRETDRRLTKLKEELDLLRSTRPRQRYTAIVEVEVQHEGDLALDLTYLVNRAGWKPLYDLRLQEEGEKPALEVSYLAQVSQNSGEDWPGVSLTLSTARPALAGVLPELDPWYVNPYVPPVYYAQAKASGPMAGRSAPPPMAVPVGAAPDMASQAAPMEEQAVEFQAAKVDSTGAAVTYQVPGGVDVPSDGSPHKVNVATYSLPPRLDYVSAPKLVEAAYRRARAANDSPFTLLPGPASLFAGEEFIGATNLELTAPNGEIELYLGADDRVKVERELKRRDVDKRLIGGKRHMVYGYEIALENLRSVPVRILVHDQIPVARHEDIKVKLEGADPRPSEQTQLNLLDWDLTLAPKEKKILRFDFSIEFPQNMQVLGLP